MVLVGIGIRRTMVAACAVTAMMLGAADLLLLASLTGISPADAIDGVLGSADPTTKIVAAGSCLRIDDWMLPWNCFDLSCVCWDLPPDCSC